MTAVLSANDLAVDLRDVDKRYAGRLFKPGVHALRGVTMQINHGAIFGLLGPNGAGKSTLVKVLMTVIRATRAHGTVLGRPVGHKPTLARVGYLPEHHKFPDYLTGAQVIDFYGALAGTPRSERRRRAGELLELVGMSRWSGTRIREYSKGMRQRVGIAQALVNDPDLVVLDEPTDGVDPVGRREIRNVLIEIRNRGKTVLLNSHLLSELEMVCDRVAIMVKGKVVRQGTIGELTIDQARYEIELAVAKPEDSVEIFRSTLPVPVQQTEFQAGAATGLAKRVGYAGTLASGEVVEIDHNVLRVRTTDPAVVQPLIDNLRARGIVIRSFRPFRPSLEDLFMEAVTDPTTGEAYKPGADEEKGGSR
jgi:ABC-2 type transport system ATP-binding protein